MYTKCTTVQNGGIVSSLFKKGYHFRNLYSKILGLICRHLHVRQVDMIARYSHAWPSFLSAVPLELERGCKTRLLTHLIHG
jgi:hypothetical protein